LRDEVKSDISGFRDELKSDVMSLKVDSKRDKSDIIKWMFIFWIGTIGSLIAIMKLL
jgi:hypothetical protein